ncbi:hypothetical protein V1525DRAFT_341545 [Lipomyces kononenkoae]|uniref:Uncharacterized protein n=1 Tax=Lipomyces kononenkoae TaxID=34357 RepID=A0ACC3T3J1_LIPKO
MVDTFAHFDHRRTCPVSALDIHRPFEPLCRTKDEVLLAMSGGGRIGFDAPYMPRACDMRWYDTAEICAILSRFDRVLFVGDAMMRHVVGALHVLVRENLGYGAVTAWNFRPDERDTCFCQGQFDPLKCSVQGIFASDDVARFDPASLRCAAGPAGAFSIQTHVITTHPPTDAELARLGDALAYASSSSSSSSRGPVALVYGHGHHNDLNVDATAGWLGAIQHTIADQLPDAVARAQLFVTPGGFGPEMYDVDVVRHGSKALSLFETAMADVCRQNQIDLLGTVNATTQTTLTDGKHSDIRTNLLKAMMVLNWLDKVDPVRGQPVEHAASDSAGDSAGDNKAKPETTNPNPNPNTNPPLKEPKLPNHAAVAAVDAQTPQQPGTADTDKRAKSPSQAESVDKNSLSKVVPQENEHMADQPGPDKAPAPAGLPRRKRKSGTRR